MSAKRQIRTHALQQMTSSFDPLVGTARERTFNFLNGRIGLHKLVTTVGFNTPLVDLNRLMALSRSGTGTVGDCSFVVSSLLGKSGSDEQTQTQTN
jgi:hypothetical protein